MGCWTLPCARCLWEATRWRATRPAQGETFPFMQEIWENLGEKWVQTALSNQNARTKPLPLCVRSSSRFTVMVVLRFLPVSGREPQHTSSSCLHLILSSNSHMTQWQYVWQHSRFYYLVLSSLAWLPLLCFARPQWSMTRKSPAASMTHCVILLAFYSEGSI